MRRNYIYIILRAIFIFQVGGFFGISESKAAAVSPDAEAILSVLNEQLDLLKLNIPNKNNVQIDVRTDRGIPEGVADSRALCKEIFNQIPNATVPLPEIYVNTPDQAQKAADQLRAMSKENWSRYIAEGRPVGRFDLRNLDRFWGNPSAPSYLNKNGEGALGGSTVVLYYSLSVDIRNYYHPLVVAMRLDAGREGISMFAASLSDSGMQKFNTESYSTEFYLDGADGDYGTIRRGVNRHTLAGVAEIGNKIVYWFLDDGASSKLSDSIIENKNLSYQLTIAPIRSESEIYCRFSYK